MNPGRDLCVVVHDAAPPTWEACRGLADVLAQHGVDRLTWLAVPCYHRQPRDPGFDRWLQDRAAAGDEVALHGFYHLDDGTPRNPVDRWRRSVYTRGEGEFWDLEPAVARDRIRAGRRWLAELGIVPNGFVAPAWLLGPGGWQALRDEPFDYTCTLGGIHRLPAGAPVLACQAQVYSSATPLRQWLSVAWNAQLARRQRAAPVVRLELHPGDLAPTVRRSWERLLRTQMATRRIRTLREAAAGIAPTGR